MPLRPLPRAMARAISGVHGDPALLWVGHLDANKDPLTVLEGFEQVATEARKFPPCVVGVEERKRITGGFTVR